MIDWGQLLEDVKLNAEKIAARAGVGRSTLLSWAAKPEADYRAVPTPENLVRTADALRDHRATLRKREAELRREAKRRERLER